MRGRFVVWIAAVCAVALGCATGNQPSAASEAQRWRTLTNDRVGFSLSYPSAWRVSGKVVATQFAAGASCQTPRIVAHGDLRQHLQRLFVDHGERIAVGVAGDDQTGGHRQR